MGPQYPTVRTCPLPSDSDYTIDVDVARTLRSARRRAGLSQRDLAERTGVAQPTIARIERGQADPRFATLNRLLQACGRDLEAITIRGEGVDRTLCRQLLALTPTDRIRSVVQEAEAMEELAAALRRSRAAANRA